MEKSKLIKKITTTTVTEEIEFISADSGNKTKHHQLKVYECGTYRGEYGEEIAKPQIILNAKWLAEAGFFSGDRIDVCVAENVLVIKKLIPV